MARLAQARVEITGDDTRFQAALRRVQAGTGKLTIAANRAGKSLANSTKAGIAGLTRFGALAGAAAASFAGLSLGRSGISTIAEFGTEISKVKALTGATGEEFAALENKARELGATTQFSASEAAAGMAFLAQAGFKANDILESSPAFLRLAAAGGLELAEAMDIASNVMSGFGLSADQSTRIADVLAKTAGSSNTNVSQLGEAFKSVGPVAKSLGIDIEQVAAAVGQLGNVGIQGESAGTALRNIFLRLSAGGSEVEKGLASLNLTLKDVSPATNSVAQIFGKFQKAVADTGLAADDATAAFAKIFGTKAVASGSALIDLNQEIESMSGNLRNAQGAAEDMADTMIDNLAGDAKALKSAFDELVLTIGDAGLTQALRDRAQGITSFLRDLAGSGQIEAFANGLGTIKDEINEIAGPFVDYLRSAFGNFFTYYQSLFSQVNFGNAFSGIGDALKSFFTLAGEVQKRLTPAFESAGGAVGRIVQSLGNGLEFVGKLIGQDLAGFFAGLNLDNFFNLENLDQVVAGISRAFDFIGRSGEKFVQTMVNGFSFVRSAFQGGNLGDLLSAGLEAGFKRSANFAITAFQTVSTQIGGLLLKGALYPIQFVLQGYSRLFNFLSGNLESVLTSGFNTLRETIGSIFSKTLNFSQQYQQTVGSIGSTLTKEFETGFASAETAASGLQNKLFAITGRFTSALSAGLKGIGQLLLSVMLRSFASIAATGPALLQKGLQEALESLGNTKLGSLLGLDDFQAASFDDIKNQISESLKSLSGVGDLQAAGIDNVQNSFGEFGSIASDGANAIGNKINSINQSVESRLNQISQGEGVFQFDTNAPQQRLNDVIGKITDGMETFDPSTAALEDQNQAFAKSIEKSLAKFDELGDDAFANAERNLADRRKELGIKPSDSDADIGSFYEKALADAQAVAGRKSKEASIPKAPNIGEILSKNLDDPALAENFAGIETAGKNVIGAFEGIETATTESSKKLKKSLLSLDESITARARRQSQADIDKAGGLEDFENALRSGSATFNGLDNQTFSGLDELKKLNEGPSRLFGEAVRPSGREFGEAANPSNRVFGEAAAALSNSTDGLAAVADANQRASANQQQALDREQPNPNANRGSLQKMIELLAQISVNTKTTVDILDERLPKEVL